MVSNKCRGRVHFVGDLNNEKISKKIIHNNVPDITQIKVTTTINVKCISNSTHSVIGTLASQVSTIFL